MSPLTERRPRPPGNRSVIVLALDTAGAACSAALWRDGAVLARRSRTMARGHAEALMPMVVAAMASGGLPLAAVDLFGVTVGPGAFTGLRIGLAAVGGLALATDRPIVGITSFDAAAHAVPADERAGRRMLVALDSKRTDLFVQVYDLALRPAGEPACVDAAALTDMIKPGPHVIAGDAAVRAASILSQAAGRGGGAASGVHVAADAGPADPVVVAALAAARAGQATPDPPAPLYLRPPDASPAPPPRSIVP